MLVFERQVSQAHFVEGEMAAVHGPLLPKRHRASKSCPLNKQISSSNATTLRLDEVHFASSIPTCFQYKFRNPQYSFGSSIATIADVQYKRSTQNTLWQ